MKHRKLRIAWSVMWGIVALLLIALWVRSYSMHDAFYIIRRNHVDANGVGNGGLWLISFNGNVSSLVEVSPFFWRGEEIRIRSNPYENGMSDKPYAQRGFAVSYGKYAGNCLFVRCPYWILLLLAVPITLLSWLPWWSNRFSLRTLLIATTLVAVGLGLIVWL